MTYDALDAIARVADGDARSALNTLEIAAKYCVSKAGGLPLEDADVRAACEPMLSLYFYGASCHPAARTGLLVVGVPRWRLW